MSVLGHADTHYYWDNNGVLHEWSNEDELPACALSMGCYCAGHARGNSPDWPCDTSEQPGEEASE